MAKSDAERARAYRDRQRGSPAKPLVPHGTLGAARRHQREKSKMCEACRLAWNQHQRTMYARKASR